MFYFGKERHSSTLERDGMQLRMSGLLSAGALKMRTHPCLYAPNFVKLADKQKPLLSISGAKICAAPDLFAIHAIGGDRIDAVS